jgi:RNA polymerase-binding transcription factor DksA
MNQLTLYSHIAAGSNMLNKIIWCKDCGTSIGIEIPEIIPGWKICPACDLFVEIKQIFYLVVSKGDNHECTTVSD